HPAMNAGADFERCIAMVASRSARTVRRTVTDAQPNELSAVGEPPPPIVAAAGTPASELVAALQLTPDEHELVWSVVARAVEPVVAANARHVFGTDARFGISLAHHI